MTTSLFKTKQFSKDHLCPCLSQIEQQIFDGSVAIFGSFTFPLSGVALEIFRQGSRMSDRGLKMTKKCSICSSFCQFSPKMIQDVHCSGLLDASNGGVIGSPPCITLEPHLKLKIRNVRVKSSSVFTQPLFVASFHTIDTFLTRQMHRV